MKATHKVIYDPKSGSGFIGSFFTGSKTECDEYCINNNGKIGHYITYITVENL